MQEIQNVDLEAQLARAELQSLKMQIHPRFLFNTLHGTSELMHRDMAAAERTISGLSDLLPTSVDHSEPRTVGATAAADYSYRRLFTGSMTAARTA